MDDCGDRQSSVWHSSTYVEEYVDRLRPALPNADIPVQLVQALLAHGDVPVRTLLDVGAGDGALTEAIASAVGATTVVLVDTSDAMLARARRRTMPGCRAVCVRADLTDERWAEELAAYAPFDAIVSSFCIHHVPDATKQAVYGSCHDLLRPGGWFFNLEHVASEFEQLHHMFEDVYADAVAAAAASEGQDAQSARRAFHERPDKAENILADVTSQCRWLRELGFTDVAVVYRWLEIALFGGRRGAGAMPGARA